MVETASLILLTLLAGAYLSVYTRLDWPAVSVTSPIVGVGVYILICTLSTATLGSMNPAASVAGAVLVLGAGVYIRRHRLSIRHAHVAATPLAVIVLFGFTRLTLPVRLTPDSAQYLAMADILSEAGGMDRISGSLLVTRGLGTAALQALGSLDGRPYSLVATPLLTMAGVALMALTIGRAARRSGAKTWLWVLLALAFTAMSNRVVYDAFYVNSHGPVMACFLATVVGGYMTVREPTWFVVAALCSPFLVVARPEGGLLAALALVPVVTSRTITARRRIITVIPTAATSVIWFGWALWSRAPGRPRPSLSDPVTIGVLIGLLLLVLALTTTITRLWPMLRRAPWLTVTGLAFGLSIAALRDRQLLVDAATATGANLVSEGLWGITWPILGALFIAAVFRDTRPEDIYLVMPITGFGVLYWLLPYARGGGYRIGAGDSGNRMLAHVFLAVLTYVILVAVRQPTSDPDPSLLEEAR